MVDHRLFSQLMERVGHNGCYQKVMLALCCGIFFQQGAISFANAFLFYQNEYECPSTITNCHEFVCQLPPDERLQYIDPSFSSLASSLGDYRCEKASEIDLAQTLGYSGGIVALVITIYLTKYLTMKNIILWALLTSVLGQCLVALSPGIGIVTGGLFIAIGARCVLNEVVYSYVSVISAEEVRAKSILLLEVFFAIAVTLLGFVYSLIRPWWLALFLYQIVPSVILLGLMFWLAQDTPQQMISHSTIQESRLSLQRIARMNGVECDIEERELDHIKTQYHQNQVSRHTETLGITDLFKFQSLRWPTIMSIGMHFFVSYQFNATQLALRDYSMSVYDSGPIIGLSEVFAMILTIFISDITPRKHGVIVSEILAFMVSLALVIWVTCMRKDECSQTMQLVQTLGLLLYRFLTSVAYNFFYLLQLQFFPSQIRAMALMTTAIAMRVAVVIFPFVQSWFQKENISIIVTFSLSCVLIIVCTIKFPQTLNVPSPQMIVQLQYEHHDESDRGSEARPAQKENNGETQ